jgi:uncharacterized protein
MPGSSKTRMVPLLGMQEAANLAACFLRDVSAAIEALPPKLCCQGYAVYSPEGSEDLLRTILPPSFGLLCRRDATLGVVLHGASEHLLALGHDCVVLVNADSPTLPPPLMVEAIRLLRLPGDRVVLGPATDGGYYLIGLKRAHESLFTGIPWSTAAVYATTVTRAAEIGLPVASLSPWYDIDEAEALAMLLAEMRGEKLDFAAAGMTGGTAAFTRAFLAKHPELEHQVAHLAPHLGP